jgi:hypothetical protein
VPITTHEHTSTLFSRGPTVFCACRYTRSSFNASISSISSRSIVLRLRVRMTAAWRNLRSPTRDSRRSGTLLMFSLRQSQPCVGPTEMVAKEDSHRVQEFKSIT